MSFIDWIFTTYPGATKVQPWGIAHILTLLGCIALIVVLALIFKNKDKSTKYKVLWVLVGLILFFEIARRVINLVKTSEFTLTGVLGTLLPRPWCAISCWALIIAACFRKKFLYNFASISALLCAIIFFAYPGVGFKSPFFGFDDLYSVVTHALLLITSISLITLGFTNFRYKKVWKVVLCFVVIFAYAFLEIYVLKIEADPLYFMPGNDVMDIIGVNHSLYLVLYSIFLLVYVNLFYVINEFKRKKAKKERLENNN
ncbi:MAG: hypothetical protein E7376_02445 [Clostridiales bacterium]|nr:hypothetical protein [Clostridiales bacterium]